MKSKLYKVTIKDDPEKKVRLATEHYANYVEVLVCGRWTQYSRDAVEILAEIDF